MSRSIGIGVIGLGAVGLIHSHSYRKVADRFPELALQPRLVICADALADRARAAQDACGFERWTTDWAAVVADPDIEIVHIATSNDMHLDIACAAAAAGKHIFCEKPVGRTPQETAEIARAAHTAGVLSFVGFNYRWAPLVQYACQLISEGQLGTLTHYRGRFFVGYGADPNMALAWRFQRELSGSGTLGDLVSHVVDMALMIAGPIKRVVANRETFIPRRPLVAPETNAGALGDVTNEDYVGALVQFADRIHGTFEACRIIKGPICQMAFEVHGTRGALSWDFDRMNELQLAFADGASERRGYTRIVSGPEHPFHARFSPSAATGLVYDDLKTIEVYQFLKSIADGRQGEPGFQSAAAAGNVLTAIERSWESGGWEAV